MVNVVLLGCGGSIPQKNRMLSSCLVRFNGKSLLFDCGEGTQIALKLAGEVFKPIDVICFTHYHADHISGLPGFLLSMGNSGRTEPVTMIGPAGLQRVVEALRVIAPELPFDIEYIELTQNYEKHTVGEFNITSARMNHSVSCFGYRLDFPRKAKFEPEKANSLGIPKTLWSVLQNGNDVFFDGKTYHPSDVMGAPRKGISVSYTTDTRPVESIKNLATYTDLMICEGMYGEPDKAEMAADKKHMTFTEAAFLAKEAETKELWLTHFSPSLPDPDGFVSDARAIFENTVCGYDGLRKDIPFTD